MPSFARTSPHIVKHASMNISPEVDEIMYKMNKCITTTTNCKSNESQLTHLKLDTYRKICSSPRYVCFGD